MMFKAATVLALAAVASAQETAYSCNAGFMEETLKPGLTAADICSAVAKFESCVTNVLAAGANDDLAKQLANIKGRYDCTAAAAPEVPPTMGTPENHLKIQVDSDKDIKFYRHRREETSVWTLKEQIDTMDGELTALSGTKQETTDLVDAAVAAAADERSAGNKAVSDAADQRAAKVDTDLGDLETRVAAAESALKATCNVDQFSDGGVCAALSTCGAGKYEATPASAAADRECKDVTAKCADGEFTAADATTISDRVCQKATACSGSEYEALPPTAVTDRICLPVRTSCPSKHIETAKSTATSDLQCQPWTECDSEQYEAREGSATKDRWCRAKSLKGISPRPWFRVTSHYRTWSGKFAGVTMYAVPWTENFAAKRYYYPDFQEVCKKYGMQTWRDEDRSSTSNYWGNQDTDTRIYGGSAVRANRCSLGGQDIMTEFYQTFRKSGRCMEARGRECDSHCGGPLLTAKEYAADLKVMGFKDDATYTMVNKKYHSSDYNNEGSWMRFKLTKDYKDVEYQARSNNAVSAHIAICACRECDDNVPCGTWGCCPRETKQCRPVHYKFGYPEFLDSR